MRNLDMSTTLRVETHPWLANIGRAVSRLLVMLAIIVTAIAAAPPQAGAADLAAAKVVVDQAKAQGTLGEQSDGYLGLVTGSAPPDVVAAMQAINAGRSEAYAQTSQKTGVTPQAAGEATALQLFDKVPAGQFIRPAGSGWVKK
jgi:uncharacterized protein YdbL (DUF1318 family)